MSVIGYIIQCDLCNARMLVTADAKDSKFCPDCLRSYIEELLEDPTQTEESDDEGDYPLGEVRG